MDEKKSATILFVVGDKEVLEGGLKLIPDFGIDAIAYAGSLDGALYQPGVLQFLEVLRNGGLGETEFIHQVATDTGIGPDQVLNDGNTCRVGQGLHHLRKLILLVGEYFCFCESH